MKRFDVTWLGQAGDVPADVRVPRFHARLERHFPGTRLFQIASWILGIPGLILSYYTAFTYIPTIRASLREGRKTAR